MKYIYFATRLYNNYVGVFSPDTLIFHRCDHSYFVVSVQNKLQALVHDILPSTTAVFSYAIGPRKQLTSSFLLVLKQW